MRIKSTRVWVEYFLHRGLGPSALKESQVLFGSFVTLTKLFAFCSNYINLWSSLMCCWSDSCWCFIVGLWMFGCIGLLWFMAPDSIPSQCCWFFPLFPSSMVAAVSTRTKKVCKYEMICPRCRMFVLVLLETIVGIVASPFASTSLFPYGQLYLAALNSFICYKN